MRKNRHQKRQKLSSVLLLIAFCTIALIAVGFYSYKYSSQSAIKSKEDISDKQTTITDTDNKTEQTTQNEAEEEPKLIDNHPFSDINTYEFPEDYSARLIKLANKSPESFEFAKDYQNKFPDNQPITDISVKKDIESNEIPIFIQWDKRWGYFEYCGEGLGLSGCAPTALSMVMAAITKDETMHPRTLAQYSIDNDYFVPNVGTKWSFLVDFPALYGIDGYQTVISEDTVRDSLNDGNIVIVNMSPGYFTEIGHFMVLKEMVNDTQVSLNDPNSIENTEKNWDLNFILGQAAGVWHYAKN